MPRRNGPWARSGRHSSGATRKSATPIPASASPASRAADRPCAKEMIMRSTALLPVFSFALTLFVPMGARAAVECERFGGFEDSTSYGEGAGRSMPASSQVYESLVVAQSPQAREGAVGDVEIDGSDAVLVLLGPRRHERERFHQLEQA